MALSYRTVQQAYLVFNDIQEQALPTLDIRSWPQDMSEWSEKEKVNPPLNVVLGYDRMSDDGWESICFFVENPSKELIKAFKELNTIKSNTSICGKYFRNEKIWCFGWF